MNVLNRLTIKHLKMNKKRTLVTIIGIILSTSLMVGLGLLISSFLNTERENAIQDFGSHHAYFENLNAEQMSTISKNINIKNSYYYIPLGFAASENMISNKPYIYVVEGSNKFLDKLELINGKLPTNDSELVISEHLNYSKEYKIGDTLKLDIGTRICEGEERDISDNAPVPLSWEGSNAIYQEEEINVKTTKTYKIVGIVKETPYESYYSAGIMVFTLNSKPGNIYNVYLEYKNPSKSFDYTKEIIKNLELEDHNYKLNESLLYFYGATKYNNINKTFLPLLIIALSVISIGCIIVIYNSFAISTMERKKSFGLYSSIGATMKQIKHTVLFEALIVGTIGIILGILGGFLGIYILIKVLNYLLESAISSKIMFSVEPLYIIIPLIFMIIVILVSAYLPAKRSSKVTPIEAIRGNDDIKISKKEVKAPKFIEHLFGIEGTIAYKNIKRNKKKYRITIISLFISIVMFNTFTSFLSYFVKTSDAIDYYGYDIGIDIHGNYESVKEDFKKINDKKYDITEKLEILDQRTVYSTNITKEDFTTMFQNIGYSDITSELGLSFKLITLPDNYYNKITNKEGILLSNKYFTTYQNNERKTIDTEVFKNKNYTLNLIVNGSAEETKKVSIDASVISDTIFGLKNTNNSSLPTLVISESTYKNKIGYIEDLTGRIAISSKKYKDIYDDYKDELIKFNSESNIFSPAIDMANTKNVILAIKILFYGFITLVTLIGVTSVINTINTNINLRRKEFAMLRSIGLTPNGFNKLLFFESLFFGLKSLLYGIPVSIGINILISLFINNVMDTSIILPWGSLIISVVAVFIIVLITMNYASKKIKRENILEALREENI